jgi:phosphatidylinositol 4-kinase
MFPFHFSRPNAQHLLLWEPVPPVIAIMFFERRYNNDPVVLQYAHRVLEQHPVELTFFFVPQVVQALRYDELGRNSSSLLFYVLSQSIQAT